eukprot:c12545_g1_i2.p1 GENE.c12545_g1_i2~~c12545_g1_i2.p1  ORF type:complete len:543 (+),score=119.46 c12545_g1_i2:134-1630(+)
MTHAGTGLPGMLIGRRLGLISRKPFYDRLVPNRIINMCADCPYAIKQFSFDGQFLICFASTNRHVVVLRLEHATPQVVLNPQGHVPEAQMDWIRDLFSVHRQIAVVTEPDTLAPDFCLHTSDDVHTIVASISVSDPLQASPLTRHTSFHILNIRTGNVTDVKEFRDDVIDLRLNNGVHLHGPLFGVCSFKKQTISIFRISEEGTFEPLRSVGRACYEDDPVTATMASHEYFSCDLTHMNKCSLEEAETGIFEGLHHRVLTSLMSQCRASNDPNTRLLDFFANFSFFESLKFTRFQFLDPQHLLIKFVGNETAELLTNRSSRAVDPDCNALFVVYNFVTTRVVATLPNSSEDLLGVLQRFQQFLDTSPLNRMWISDSPSPPLRPQPAPPMSFGKLQAVKRALASLPVPPVTVPHSPFLDPRMYSFDPVVVACLAFPHKPADLPLKFVSRRSSRVRFKIVMPSGVPQTVVTVAFHPSLPIAITYSKSPFVGATAILHVHA